MTPILSEIAQETEQCTVADLDRLRELLNPDSLLGEGAADDEKIPKIASLTVAPNSEGTYFSGGRI